MLLFWPTYGSSYTPSRHRYLGKAGSKAYLKAVEALSRRGRIEALERGISTLSMGLSDLVEEASRFNKGSANIVT